MHDGEHFAASFPFPVALREDQSASGSFASARRCSDAGAIPAAASLPPLLRNTFDMLHQQDREDAPRKLSLVPRGLLTAVSRLYRVN